MANGIIEHSGIIESVNSGHVSVKIVQTSACAICKASSFCQSSENKEKIVDVYMPVAEAQRLKVGQSVMVCVSESMGKQALFYAFILPLIVLFTALTITWLFSHREPLASAVCIAVLVPYYVLLYMMRDKMWRTFRFWIK
ncbi:MAG: SoxR reducing system RseC family protein [Prevotella sp.]|nr:SoxR reducing system RseC family protein [Candidatus Equicola faecalis]